MPTSELQSIRDSLKRAEDLADQVRKLRLQNRLIMIGIGVLVVVILFAGGVALYARSAANKAQDALVASKAQTAVILVEACRARNAANAATRDALEANVAAFNHAFSPLAQTPDQKANLANIVKELHDAIPTPDHEDRDCSTPSNGLGPEDYPS